MHWLESTAALLSLAKRLLLRHVRHARVQVRLCASRCSGARSPQQLTTTSLGPQRDAAGWQDWQAPQRAPDLSGFVVNFAAFCRISPQFANFRRHISPFLSFSPSSPAKATNFVVHHDVG